MTVVAVTRWSFEPKPLSLTLLSRSASKPCLAAIAKSLTHWADPKSGLSCVALSDVNRLMGGTFLFFCGPRFSFLIPP